MGEINAAAAALNQLAFNDTTFLGIESSSRVARAWSIDLAKAIGRARARAHPILSLTGCRYDDDEVRETERARHDGDAERAPSLVEPRKGLSNVIKGANDWFLPSACNGLSTKYTRIPAK